MNPVYLDHAATTPVRPEVQEAMIPFAEENFGNPSSQHRWGREASAALEDARAEAAAALGVRNGEICFVRGGTEGDNLALGGACHATRETAGPASLWVSAIEHHAVLHLAEHLADTGSARLNVFPVRPDGSVDLDALGSALGPDPAVLSCMWVNNETGIVLPVEALSELTRDTDVIFHTDAVQAVGKLDVDLSRLDGIDLLTVSGHKIYGPKGTGLLFVRGGTALTPLLYGGGQERRLRPGTEDVGGAVGLATALRLAVEERTREAERLSELRTLLERRLTSELDGVVVAGDEAVRAPHVANIGFEGVDTSMLLINLDLEGIAVSGASACQSGSSRGSHVIEALYGPGSTRAHVRYSLGRLSDDDGIRQAVDTTVDVVRRLRDTA
ncbi:MAG: cysteine desulfurase family protein [Gemmatimonadota bacterium]|nr:cysteine desulfurase family protein [Gemmatimonadota bacterium]